MSAATFDPFAIEKPVLRLGEHGEWTLGDITESRQKRIADLTAKFSDVSSSEESMLDVAAVVGELAEAACEQGEGLKDLIVGLADESVHGEQALGARALVGLVTFIGEWLVGESEAGEG